MFRAVAISTLLVLVLAAVNCGQAPGSIPAAPNSIEISPRNAPVGSADLQVTVVGSGFRGTTHSGSVVVWAESDIQRPLDTTFVSATQLIAVIPADLLSNPINAEIFVETGDLMGDAPLMKSELVSFTVSAAALGPASVTSISPTSTGAGSPDLTLAIMGSNFDGTGAIVSRAVWKVNGTTTALATTFVSDTLLTAVIPAALLASPAEAKVTVQRYDRIEGVVDGATNSVNFSVN